MAEKKQGLPPLGQRGHDPFDVGQKAEVEHLVRLVEHEHLDVLQRKKTPPHQVEQPAGGRDENVHAVLELADLRLFVDAAEDHRVPKIEVLAVGRDALADLGGKLSGGRHDQHAHARVVAGLGVDVLERG